MNAQSICAIISRKCWRLGKLGTIDELRTSFPAPRLSSKYKTRRYEREPQSQALQSFRVQLVAYSGALHLRRIVHLRSCVLLRRLNQRKEAAAGIELM